MQRTPCPPGGARPAESRRRAGVGEVHEERDGGAEDVRVQKTDAKTHRGGRAREVDRGGGLADAPFPGGHGDDARHTGEASRDGGCLKPPGGAGVPGPPMAANPRRANTPSRPRIVAEPGAAGRALAAVRPSWKSPLVPSPRSRSKFELELAISHRLWQQSQLRRAD